MPALRLATPDDVPAMHALIARSVRGLSAGFYTPDEAERALVHVFGVDSRLIADGTYYAVEEGGRLAACGGWSRRRTLYGGDQAKAAEDPLLDPAREPARIRALFVDPDFARRGLGRLVFDACHAAARDAGFRALELVATLPGVPLYEALGFAEVERLEVPMPGGAGLPVVRMSRPVTRAGPATNN